MLLDFNIDSLYYICCGYSMHAWLVYIPPDLLLAWFLYHIT